MKIVVVGTGYVGLVSGVCFSEFGYTVICVDKDEQKIASLQSGKSPIYEPGLDALMEQNINAGFFTTELAGALAQADIVFIAVGTPTRSLDGHADLSYVFAAAEEIARSSTRHLTLVTKSTVPAGTGRKLAQLIRETNAALDFDIVSNPEFLREGSAIQDFMQPDRVIVGVESARAEATMRTIYRPITLAGRLLFLTSIESAELIKYAANSFLAVKIAFINEMADLCEKLGANIADVAQGMGLDARIGARYLEPGPGYGGSCFPKDTLALVKMAEAAETRSRIVEAAILSNDLRKYRMAEKILDACGGNLRGKTIAVLGVTFKAGTDDMRDSASLAILPELLRAGARIRAYDPQGMKEAAYLLPSKDIDWCMGSYQAMEGADLLVLLTEWHEFMRLDLARVKRLLRSPLVIDLRNIYKRDEMAQAGLDYISIGRAPLALRARETVVA
jgi:UDPglucose 6-dehydrogenase